MSKHVLRGGMLAAMSMVCWAGSAWAVKPPDLPLDLTGKCQRQNAGELCPSLDTICPAFFNTLTQGTAQAADSPPNAAEAPPTSPPARQWNICQDATDNDAACDPHWLREAKHLYAIGINCRQSGDAAMARSCFLEVQLLCPRSSFSRLARKQLEMMVLDQFQHAARMLHGDSSVRLAGLWTAQQPDAPASDDSTAQQIQRRRCQQDVEQRMVRQAEHARKMYHRGERCRLAGELEQALDCFRAAHRLCPQCAFGQRAMQHICEIERQLLESGDEGIGEEQDAPPKSDEIRELEIFRATVPLEIYLDEPSENQEAPAAGDEPKSGSDNQSYEVPPPSSTRDNFGSIEFHERGPVTRLPLREVLETFCNCLDMNVTTSHGLRAAITIGGNVWKITCRPDWRFSVYVPPLRNDD